MTAAVSDQDPELGKTVDVAGIRTNYLEMGTGTPVVLIHGSGPGVTAYANWRFTLPALGDEFRVLALDVVGFGHTQRPENGQYDLDFWINHVVGFLDALGIAKAHLVGNSFGGGIALALTARHPERVGRLVLMGACATEFPLTEGLDAVWGYEPSPENMERAMQHFAYNRGLINNDIVMSRYRASVRPGYQESYSRMFPAPRQRHITMMSTPDDALRDILHPILLVHGRDDRIIPVEASIKLNRLLDNSELHVFGRCGHWTQIEKKDRFNELIKKFFSSEAF